MRRFNAVVVMSMCEAGRVTQPKIKRFVDEISVDDWYSIAVPEMGAYSFSQLVDAVQITIQEFCDEREKMKVEVQYRG